MTIQRRRVLLTASTAGAAALLASCSLTKHPGPEGDWERLEDGDLLLAVPKGRGVMVTAGGWLWVQVPNTDLKTMR